jgi:hypothetical protein
MFLVNSKTEFETVTFPFTNEIEIESSYNQLSDTGRIVIPRNINFVDDFGRVISDVTKGENAVFKRGDSVKISMGYDQKSVERFKGVISGVRNKFPLEMEFDDQMYFLKQNSLTFTMDNPTLPQLLKKIIPEGVKYEITKQQTIGEFRVSDSSTAKILDELRQKQKIFSWFRNDILYIGLSFVPELQKRHKFEMYYNIIDGDSLKWVNAFDRKIKIKAVSILDDNSRVEATAGDEDGAIRTLFFENIKEENELLEIAESHVNEYKFDGFDGSFTTFGDQWVNHGDIVELTNPKIPEQNGNYLVDKVVTNCGMNGLKQTISIKQRVA